MLVSCCYVWLVLWGCVGLCCVVFLGVVLCCVVLCCVVLCCVFLCCVMLFLQFVCVCLPPSVSKACGGNGLSLPACKFVIVVVSCCSFRGFSSLPPSVPTFGMELPWPYLLSADKFVIKIALCCAVLCVVVLCCAVLRCSCCLVLFIFKFVIGIVLCCSFGFFFSFGSL